MKEENNCEEWPFEDGPSAPVFTTGHVIIELRPIVHAVRAADGDWQFLSSEGADESSLKIVALKTLLSRHPYVKDISDLHLGWEAWRPDNQSPWSRRKIVGRQ
ncbi:hypothetical protein GCM10023212_12150 [Luteolibacter yonseiensis]|uniref:hypothetical protein n=1 Tax=Luteolibacter yonseiensis TaxID=1144680 RepID=UPI0031EC230D